MADIVWQEGVNKSLLYFSGEKFRNFLNELMARLEERTFYLITVFLWPVLPIKTYLNYFSLEPMLLIQSPISRRFTRYPLIGFYAGKSPSDELPFWMAIPICCWWCNCLWATVSGIHEDAYNRNVVKQMFNFVLLLIVNASVAAYGPLHTNHSGSGCWCVASQSMWTLSA